MTPDDKLALFFQAAPVAERDPVFVSGVMEKVARRQAWLTWLAMAPWAIAAAVLLWAARPVLVQLTTDLTANAMLSLQALGVIASVLATLYLSGLFEGLPSLTKNSRSLSHL